jgi:hypothetical protein
LNPGLLRFWNGFNPSIHKKIKSCNKSVLKSCFSFLFLAWFAAAARPIKLLFVIIHEWENKRFNAMWNWGFTEKSAIHLFFIHRQYTTITKNYLSRSAGKGVAQ